MIDHPHSRALPSHRPILLVVGALVGVSLLLGLTFLLHNAWWNVVFLGIVEGITEFLPISSTGHLLIASRLIGYQNNIGGTFEIFIQLGAVLAVFVYYARDLLVQARAVRADAPTRHFWLAIIIAFLPAAVVGLLLRDWIKRVLFTSPTVIAWSLIIGGLVFILVERLPQRASVNDIRGISVWQALGIGLAQILALIPGVSRSGASIIGGLLGGLDRSTATAFAFYLALPTLGAATVVDLLGSLDQIVPGDILRLALGTLVAFIVAWLSIRWLLRFVTRHTFVIFGAYRILAGLIILALVAANWL